MTGYDGHLLAESFVQERAAEPSRLALGAATQPALKVWCESARTLGPASSMRAMVDMALMPLLEILELRATGQPQVTDDGAWLACLARHQPVVVCAGPWGSPLAGLWRTGMMRASQTNASWCLFFNGTHVRLAHASRLHSRRHAEIVLESAADDPVLASALVMLFGVAALGGPGTSAGSLGALVADAERHAATVCRSLRAGVLEASTAVLRALAARERASPLPEVFEQSLTIVYRLLFLFFAEARALVPLWHPLYRESYSVEALRDAALTPGTVGLWDGLRAVARLAHAGCRTGGLNVTAFNGRLFSPSRTPLAERRGLDDAAARQAIVAVSTRPAADGTARERIFYRDLGVEQLGAVYETLLDYEPQVERGGRTPRVSLQPGSGVRKATGTFYTPRSLVEYLVRDTLAPLVTGATPEHVLALRVLDPSMGSGAFLVEACRFLAAAYETALVDAGRCHASDLGPAERASIRRLVAERCLFGVDINPTAVQLARLSLWLTTLAADRPLTFLDHHLRVGDSLAGTWLSRLRTPPRSQGARVSLPLFPDAVAGEALRQAVPVRFTLAHAPNDTAEQVRAKERTLASLTAATSPLAQWSRVADLWCAAWLASPPLPPAAFADLSEAILTGHSTLPRATRQLWLERVEHMSRARRLFHWELEFPEVFFDSEGQRRPDAGFDAILGNPPWDMIRADGHGDRRAARADASSLVRFARDSGVYEVRADGQVNRYQLFVERTIALSRSGGRLGLVLPSGALSDAGSAALRRLLFSRCAVERVVGFDNRAGTFPIHRGVKFVLVSATAGSATREAWCRFGETDPAGLSTAAGDTGPEPAWFPLRITPALLEKVSGAHLSVPDLRTTTDLAILERAAHLFAPLGSATGWQARFGRELNATEDRGLLRGDRPGYPVLEGKLLDPFRARPDGARWRISPEDAQARLGSRVLHPRLAYRDVASATNRVTLIAALLPAHSASTHTLFCLKTPMPLDDQHLLCAFFNSLVVNFLVRQRVSTHVTTALVEQLPIPLVHDAGPWADELSVSARRLADHDDAQRVARLNAVVARIYRLSVDEFTHVLGTFPLIDRTERESMLAAFRRL